jgi:hypothetical protein
VVSRLFTDEDVTGGAEGGECAAGGVSVPHPPDAEPRSKQSGMPQDCPPPTVSGETSAWSATLWDQSTPHSEARKIYQDDPRGVDKG